MLFEGSIGNTSDNLEAVSEAASNHSVASSLELETEDQNDNLSDMVSANVSGRGTPNISGNLNILSNCNPSNAFFSFSFCIFCIFLHAHAYRSRHTVISNHRRR